MAAPLIHIGYHKTGTKWLRGGLFLNKNAGYHWIDKDTPPVRRIVREHPLEFDPEESRREFEPLLAEAEKKRLMPVICWGRLAGQAFSGGYDTKEIADRLKAVFPDGRIVVVVREQRSMIVSTYKQYLKAGGPAGIEAFLQPGSDQGWRIPLFDFDYFRYHLLIGYYNELFGADNVLALPYEELVRDRRSFLTKIGEFSGNPVPDEVLAEMTDAKRRNPAQSALVLGATRVLNRFGPRSELNPSPLLESMLVHGMATKMRKKLDPANLRATRRLAQRSEQSLKQAVAEAVGDRYVESNRITAELLGVDLAACGWML
jgi:Sulfotransferase family